MTKNSLGNRIKSRLDELGKGPQWLADRISASFPKSKCDVKCIHALITRNSQRTSYATQIAQALNVSLIWLIDGTGSMLLEEAANQANQDRALYATPVAGAILPKSKRQRLSEKISAALEGINEDGLLVALGRIQTLADEYPRATKQTPQS